MLFSRLLFFTRGPSADRQKSFLLLNVDSALDIRMRPVANSAKRQRGLPSYLNETLLICFLFGLLRSRVFLYI
jgi:hypothetical protein